MPDSAWLEVDERQIAKPNVILRRQTTTERLYVQLLNCFILHTRIPIDYILLTFATDPTEYRFKKHTQKD